MKSCILLSVILYAKHVQGLRSAQQQNILVSDDLANGSNARDGEIARVSEVSLADFSLLRPLDRGATNSAKTTMFQHSLRNEHLSLPNCMNAIKTLRPFGNPKSCSHLNLDGSPNQQHTDYISMAKVSETKFDAVGLRADSHDVTQFQLNTHGMKRYCRLEDRLAILMHTYPFWQQWQHGHEKDLRDAYAYARYGDRKDPSRGVKEQWLHGVTDDATHTRIGVTEACNRLAAASVAWKIRNGYLGHDSGVPSMLDVVQEQHHWMEVYYGTKRLAPKLTLQGDQKFCYNFPKPAEILCRGGLAQYPMVSEMEDILPGGRNLWYHEFDNLIDFTAYRPLPSLAGFDTSVIAKARKILIVAGANGFFRASKHLIDMYRPYFEFDRVIMIEPDAERMMVPKDYNLTGNVEWVHGYLQVASCDKSDLIKYINDHVSPEDFVVVMFDVDAATNGATMEWGWLAQLTAQDLRLVDELYIELHMYKPEIGWTHDRHSAREQYDVMHQLRNVCGAAVHAWP